jgi:hypothetical protein
MPTRHFPVQLYANPQLPNRGEKLSFSFSVVTNLFYSPMTLTPSCMKESL